MPYYRDFARDGSYSSAEICGLLSTGFLCERPRLCVSRSVSDGELGRRPTGEAPRTIPAGPAGAWAGVWDSGEGLGW